MRRLLALTLAGCLAAVGCNKGETAGTKSGGGTGSVAETTTSKKKSKETRPTKPPGIDEVVPTSITLKQGETKASRVNIKRQGGYDKEIKLTFDTGDTGLTIPAVTVPATKEEKQQVDISITAAKDAKGGTVEFNYEGEGLESKPGGQFIVSVARNRKK